MTSNNVTRLVRGSIAVLYAVIYGFWTMFVTGGGHGNFIWLFLFIIVEFFGLYFPIMAVLGVDLRSRVIRMVFGALIVFNIVSSCVLIRSWVSGGPGASRDDFAKTLELSGAADIYVCAAAHFLPTIFFAFQLVRSMMVKIDPSGDYAIATPDP